MNRKQRIKLILLDNFHDAKIEVIDNSMDHAGHNNFDGSHETHFKIILNGTYKKNNSRLLIHKKINQLLKEEFISGLHALEIKLID